MTTSVPRPEPGAVRVDLAGIRERRATQPETVACRLEERTRRPFLRGDGRLLIIAADHTARGVFSAGLQADVMADREGLLERLLVALSRPGVDGVLGTADILEDLALLGALDGKLAIGTVNRGGLAGSTFEIDDRTTGYDVDALVRSRLDGGKVLLRICLQDDHTAEMLERTARLVDAASAARLPILIEAFMSVWVDGRLVNHTTADAVSHAVAIAAGLGGSSAWSWLKIPVVPDMARVMRATTLPTLLLGGDSPSDPARTYETWAEALSLPGVRGLVVGRSLLYPADGDVASHVDVAAGLVHATARLDAE
jgi:DhnA family fructose-bisphosphate aldolase class Ia